MIKSLDCPQVTEITFYIRGNDSTRNNIILIVESKEFDKIQKAVSECLESKNKQFLYKACFLYQNKKDGAKKRRMVNVQSEDSEYLTGIDLDASGPAFKKFLKSNIIGRIDKLPLD